MNEGLVHLSQHEVWNDVVGDAWVHHAELHDRQAEPFGHAVMDALGDLAGVRVLDVGCGTGATTLHLIARGAAEVVGVDLSEPMVAAARATIRNSQVDVRWADVLDLAPGNPFDVVFSRFGVMFFSDPVSAFARLRVHATPDARLGFCCWGPPAANPVMTLPVMASVPVLGPPALAGPGEPGPFSLADPAVVRGVLTAAGWTAIEIGELQLDAPHPAGDADAVADVVMDFNPLLVDGVRRNPDRRTAVRAAIVDAVRPFERDGVVHLAAHALIVTARASATS